MSRPPAVGPPGTWGPPPAPRPAATATVVTGRVVTILLLLVVAAWAFGLLFATLASVMSGGSCDSEACGVRVLGAAGLPWVVWLLSLVVGIVGLCVDWRRTRVWLWGLLAVALNALAMLAVLVLLFGWTFWSA